MVPDVTPLQPDFFIIILTVIPFRGKLQSLPPPAPFFGPSGARLETWTPATPQKPPSLRGAEAGGLPSAFSLGTRRARLVEGRVGPECTSETRGGLGEYTDVPAMLICRSILSSSSALLLWRTIPPCSPLRYSWTSTPFPSPASPPAVERGHGLLPSGSVRRGRGAAGSGAGLPATERSRSFSRVAVGTFEVRAYF